MVPSRCSQSACRALVNVYASVVHENIMHHGSLWLLHLPRHAGRLTLSTALLNSDLLASCVIVDTGFPRLDVDTEGSPCAGGAAALVICG
eukprot:1148859-Pelagomonas_calceolata.AAC.9